MQSYWEITSDGYLEYIKDYVVGIGPWKDTVVPPENNYLTTPTDLVAKAHAHDLQVRYLNICLLDALCSFNASCDYADINMAFLKLVHKSTAETS